MEVFRITRGKYKKELSGKGAAKYGGRWNSKGTEVIYTSSNRSLAMAEVAVSLDSTDLFDSFFMLTVYVPDAIKAIKLSVEDLPKSWNSFPRTLETKLIIDNIIQENKYATISVPSVVVKGEFNIIINPNHKAFSKIKIIDCDPFPFDKRLFYK